MNIKPETREILRQYKALINARRRDAGQRELTTAQVMDEICEYMTCQCAVYIGGHFILQGGKGGRPPVSPREKTCRLAPAGGRTRAALRAAHCPFPHRPLMAYTYSRFLFSEDVMSGLNLAATSKEDQDKVAIDLVASGVAYKERLAMPVAREQPEHLKEYFWVRLEHYRQVSAQLPDKNAPEYARKEDEVKK